MDEDNSVAERLRDTAKLQLLAVDRDRAAVGLIDPRQDLHQGGFARSVLSDHGEHFLRPKPQRHSIQGLHSRKTLADFVDFEESGCHLPRSFLSSWWNASTLSFLMTRWGTCMIPSAGKLERSPFARAFIILTDSYPNRKGCCTTVPWM